MTDILRNVAGTLIEVPEEVADQLGNVFGFIADQLEKIEQRLDELEQRVRGTDEA